MFTFDTAISSTVKTAAPHPAAAEPAAGPLSSDMLALMHRYWNAANYLTIGQIYLQENPLLTEPLRPEHIKPRLLGHWGTSPGLSLVYAHVNRLIRKEDVDAIFLAGPGPGGPREHVPRGDVLGDLSRGQRGRGGHAPPLPPVLEPVRRAQPRQPADAR